MLIGVCGKSGSGKSSFSKDLACYDGFYHVDIDKIGHKVLLLDEVKEELIRAFGEDVVRENIVDREKLGQIVFNNRKQMDKLNNITWKYMEIEIDMIIESNKDKVIVLDWLLLPLTKYFQMCTLRILLDVPYEIRKQRVLLRDNISEEDFDLRESASIEYNEDDFHFVYKDFNFEYKSDKPISMILMSGGKK